MALTIFSIAFAFVEAAVVFYLRNLLGYKLNYPLGNYQTLFSLDFISFIKTNAPILGSIQVAKAEIIREVATMLMLGSVAYLSAEKLKQRIGALLITFALWDIFYYVFLKFLTGWPASFFDIDIYFLIPVAWIGPVITPVVISTILFLVGLRFFGKK